MRSDRIRRDRAIGIATGAGPLYPNAAMQQAAGTLPSIPIRFARGRQACPISSSTCVLTLRPSADRL
jgi:hypothetical protein